MPAHYGVVLVETSNQPGNHDSCFSGADRRRINLSRPGSLYGPRVSWRDTSSRSGCGCSSLLSVPHDDELAVSSSSTRGIGAAGCVVPRQRVTGVSCVARVNAVRREHGISRALHLSFPYCCHDLALDGARNATMEWWYNFARSMNMFLAQITNFGLQLTATSN
jgi:hypothetical protein